MIRCTVARATLDAATVCVCSVFVYVSARMCVYIYTCLYIYISLDEYMNIL